MDDQNEYWQKVRDGAASLLDRQSDEGLQKAWNLSKNRINFIGQHMTPSETLMLGAFLLDIPGMHEGLLALNEIARTQKIVGFFAVQALMFLGIMTLSLAEVRADEEFGKLAGADEKKGELPN